jgi:FixJ family two-component response regulator/GAF domain-containing protein
MAETTPRVLVVDDERFFREAIRDALAEAGIECETLESGAAGLVAARDPQVGVVVLDVTLPDMSGIDLLRRLHNERPAQRVIVLSSHTDQELVLEALRLDASDYLAKPLHDEELVLAVRRALAAFDVESSWRRLRERLRRLETQMLALAARLEGLEGLDGPDGPEDVEEEPFQTDLEAFAALSVEAVADVLGAGKTSLMLFDEEANELRVVAATGTSLEASEMDPVALGKGVAGVALSLGEAVIVDDVYTDDRFAGRTVHERYESASLAVAPLYSGRRPLGVLCATDRLGAEPFGADELALLKILAIPTARFLAAVVRAAERPREAPAEPPQPLLEAAPGPEQTARLADAESAVALEDDAELAREICEVLTQEIEPGRVLAGVLRPVARRLPNAVVSLYLIDNPTGELLLEGQVDDEGPGDRERLPRDRGLTATVLQTGGLVATDYPERDPRFDPQVDTPADGVARPLLCVPLRLRGKVLGLFRAFPSQGVGASARTGEILSATLSAAVRNALLYRSLLESIDEVADARRAAANEFGP